MASGTEQDLPSPPLPPPVPSGGGGGGSGRHRRCRRRAGHLGACGAPWLLPLRRPLGARGGGGEERDIHSNAGCAGRRAGPSAGGGSPRAPAARGARRPAAPARRARARVALALRVRLSGKPSRELSQRLPPAPATHPREATAEQ